MMTTTPKSERFRQHHLSTLIETYDLTKGSLDFFVTSYFRKNPQLGSKDRAYISEALFRYMRMKSLFDALMPGGFRIEKLVSLLEKDTDELLLQASTFPPFVRFCCPKDLYESMTRTWKERTNDILTVMFERAPTYLRTNLLRTTREALIQQLHEAGIEASKVAGSETALRLAKRANLFSLPIFQSGWFEMQDLASIKVASLVDPKPRQRVLDYCAGSGGKTLAFAPKMMGHGQIYLHDIRKEALLEARKRLKRAGIQNAQCIHEDEERKLQEIQGTCDWVLVDAPCSGSGTYRRNPDMKWRFSKEMEERLVLEQREIFKKAFSYLKPNGRIVYATCSLLAEENQEQLEFFEKNYPVERVQEPFQSVPVHDGMDGLFGVVLRRSSEKC